MKSLNVTLGFRASADLAALAEKDWQPDARLRIDTQYVPSMLNCFDESAAELMLRLRDSAEVQNVELALCALTIDDGRADRHLKNLGALGFGEMVRIDALPEGIDLRFNPQAAAKMVATWHGHSPQRLIVMGMESGDGVDFQTALCLAEALGWPCVTQVSDVSLRPEASGEVNEIVVIRRAEGVEQTLTLSLPAVLAVGNSSVASALRVPTLKQKLAAGKMPIVHLTPQTLGVEDTLREDGVQLTALNRQLSRRAGLIIEGATPREKASALYQNYLKERMG